VVQTIISKTNQTILLNMEIQMITSELLDKLRKQARQTDRLRQNFDLRNSPTDTSQRMLNVLEPGTSVPIHRHTKTSESVICLEGCLDWIFYEELPTVDCGGPVHDGQTVKDERCFKEVARFRVCPREGIYGIQVPIMTWHTIEMHEASAIFEVKDGAYGK